MFCHVLGGKLPKSFTVLGDGELKYLPGPQRTGGGPRLDHVIHGGGANYESTTPTHTVVVSDWQLEFRRVKAQSDEKAVELVRNVYIPRFQSAYFFATHLELQVVVSGVINEKTREEFSAWSYSGSTQRVDPKEFQEQEKIDAEAAIRVLIRDQTAFAAATLLSRAQWRLKNSGGVDALQASAVLDSVQVIEKISQTVSRIRSLSTPEPAEDVKIMQHLADLEQAFGDQKTVKQKLRLVEKISRRATEVLNLGVMAQIENCVEYLGMQPQDLSSAKKLWRLRSSKLAHPGEFPDRLDREALTALSLARRFLNAYISYQREQD